jgi:homocysteine S-methyltransferase
MSARSAARDLSARLSDGPPIIIDGGTGSELERRGAKMHEKAWSARAALTDAELVRGVHADYLAAGAEIIIANTYSSNYHIMAYAGLTHEFSMTNRRSVEIAREARDNAENAPEQVWVAGGMSTTTFTDGLDRSVIERAGDTTNGYREQARIIADAGVDLLILEMMRDVQETVRCLDAAMATGLPVWLGLSAEGEPGGDLRLFGSQVPFEEGVARILDSGLVPQAAGVMHTQIDITSDALEALGELWDGPLFTYPHHGVFEMPRWRFDNTLSPDEFAAAALTWVQKGVRAVGGCCGIRPEHIRAVSAAVNGISA